MRTVRLATLVALAGLVAGAASACSSTSGPAPNFDLPDSGDDATAPNPRYCIDTCDQQANDGTLHGPLSQCVADCCQQHPDGCPPDGGTLKDSGPDVMIVEDTGAPPGDGGDPDACAPCGSRCCTSKEICLTDGTNNWCASTCSKTSDCPTDAQCCTAFSPTLSACTAGSQDCRCTLPGDCSTGCCAPMTNAAGDPVGPYVCKNNDGQAYDCCKGAFTNCSSPYCCVTDNNGNEFCAQACTAGGTECGKGRCETFKFGAFTTTCAGPTACGP